MKLSFILLFALLQCELISLFPTVIIGYPSEKNTTTKYNDPRFDRKENSYYYVYNKNSSLRLTLYDGFKYKITIVKWFIENPYEATISFGSYSINRDKSYTFSDIPTGIEFRAYKSGDSLKLAEKITLKGDMELRFNDDIDQRYYLEELAKIQKIKLRDSCPDFKCGVYLAGSDSMVMLNLRPDHVFEFHVFDVPLSSGRWRQHNAEIILSDSCLNKEMKLIVDKEQLICSFMPGNLTGTELYLKEPVKTLSSNRPTSSNTNRAWIYIGIIGLFSLGSLIVIRRKRKTK